MLLLESTIIRNSVQISKIAAFIKSKHGFPPGQETLSFSPPPLPPKKRFQWKGPLTMTNIYWKKLSIYILYVLSDVLCVESTSINLHIQGTKKFIQTNNEYSNYLTDFVST